MKTHHKQLIIYVILIPILFLVSIVYVLEASTPSLPDSTSQESIISTMKSTSGTRSERTDILDRSDGRNNAHLFAMADIMAAE